MGYLDSLFNLNGKVAMLTGGGGVLAGAIGSGLAKAGVRIVFADIALDHEEEAAERINHNGGEAIGISSNVLDVSSLEKTRDDHLNFNENYLFEGDIDMYEVMKILVHEMKKRKKEVRPDWQIPMRPDHGNQMLGDIGKENYPGYGLYRRMKSLAEIKGLELGVIRNNR